MSAAIKLSSPATNDFWEIPVLFEDAQLLVLDKPAGLLAMSDASAPQQPSLMSLLHTGIANAKPWARERGLTFLRNAHRLDPETSGAMLLAKSKTVLTALADQFGGEQSTLRYVALVKGEPKSQQFFVDAKIAAHPAKPGVMRVDSGRGKKSRTWFEVREMFSGYALVDGRPVADRRHQMRVHLRQARLGVVGDPLYGTGPLFLSRLKRNYRLKPGRTERPLIARVALHAEKLTITHPVTGNALTITAPWPKDMVVAVKYLRLFAPPGKPIAQNEVTPGSEPFARFGSRAVKSPPN